MTEKFQVGDTFSFTREYESYFGNTVNNVFTVIYVSNNVMHDNEGYSLNTGSAVNTGTVVTFYCEGEKHRINTSWINKR